MKASRIRTSIVFVIIFLVFLGLMDYPFISRLINERNFNGVILDYEQSTKQVQSNERDEEIKKAELYNEDLANKNGIQIEDAFSTENQMSQTYKALLNHDELGVMGVLSIPEINLSLPIYHGTGEAVLQKGVGHLEGTSLPIGGNDTHAVISAHRGLPSKKLFTDLDLLKKDDLFFIQVFDKKLAYRIIDIEVIKPSELDILRIQKGKDFVTLITCTPYGVNTHRLCITGERTDYREDMEDELQGSRLSWIQEWWWLLVNIVLLIIMGLLLFQYNRRAKAIEDRKKGRSL